MAVSQLIHESGKKFYCDIVCTVIIVSVTREIANGLEINYHALLIADGLYFCVFDCA